MKQTNCAREEAPMRIADLAVEGIAARIGDPIPTEMRDAAYIRSFGYVGLHPDDDITPAEAVVAVMDETMRANIMTTPDINGAYDDFVNTLYDIVGDDADARYEPSPLVLQIRTLLASA